MKYLFTLCLLVFSLSASAQWQQTGSRVRYVNGLGIPTRDTVAGVLADSSQILIRPADSSLYVKYKRTWLRVGGGGGSIAGSGTTNYIPKFTSASAIGNSQIFDNGTNVGIGTTSPAALLNVNTATTNNAKIRITGNGSGTSNSAAELQLYDLSADHNWNLRMVDLLDNGNFIISKGTFGANTNDYFTINTLGNVGIGDSSPSDLLVVNGRARINGDNKLAFGNSSGGYAQIGLTGALEGNLQFFTYDGSSLLERMRITSSGNVGIGTASPSSKLNLDEGTFIVSNAAATTSQVNIGIGTLTTGRPFIGTNTNTNPLEIGTRDAVSAIFVTNSLERMRITAAGNALIGTTTDNGSDRLQVSGSSFFDGVVGIGATNPGGGQLYVNSGIFASSNSAPVTFRAIGNTNNNTFRANNTMTFGSIGNRSGLVGGSGSNDSIMTLRGETHLVFASGGANERVRITSSGGNLLISTTTDNNTDKLQVNGSIQGTGFNQAYTAKTGTYTATTSDYFIDCTTGTFTVNLFTAVGNTGRILIIKNSGTGTITVDPNGAQTIDGAATQSLSTQWSRVHIISDGANWKIISN